MAILKVHDITSYHDAYVLQACRFELEQDRFSACSAATAFGKNHAGESIIGFTPPRPRIVFKAPEITHIPIVPSSTRPGAGAGAQAGACSDLEHRGRPDGGGQCAPAARSSSTSTCHASRPAPTSAPKRCSAASGDCRHQPRPDDQSCWWSNKQYKAWRRHRQRSRRSASSGGGPVDPVWSADAALTLRLVDPAADRRARSSLLTHRSAIQNRDRYPRCLTDIGDNLPPCPEPAHTPPTRS